MNLSSFIAKRYLFSKKSKSIINIISLISVVGVFVSSAAMVIVLSGFNGIERLVENIYSQHEADLRITPSIGKTFVFSDSIIESIHSYSEVESVSKIIEEITMIKHDQKWMTATMKGVDDSYRDIIDLDASVIENNENYWSEYHSGAIIGVGLQNQLQVSSNTRFDNTIIVYGLLRDKKLTTTNKSAFKPKKIAVNGVFNINPEFDQQYLFVPFYFAKDLLNYNNEINALEIKLKSETSPKLFKPILKKALGAHFSIETQYEKNELIYKTNAAEKWMVFMILIFIFILSTFNIIASLTMLILDKKKDISTLISLGATQQLIKTTFFKEGLYINIIGGGLGVVFGTILCLAQKKLKLIALENAVIDHWPVIVELTDLFSVLFVIITVGILASYLPTNYIINRHFKHSFTYFAVKKD